MAVPLAESLRAQGVKVWYDRFELKLGDSLRRSIDEGLRLSRFGVVVLSPHFFAKEWPQRELDALYQRLIREGRPLLLPVWYKLGAGEIAKYSPLLSDILAARWGEGLDTVVQQILAVLRPAQPELPPSSKGAGRGSSGARGS